MIPLLRVVLDNSQKEGLDDVSLPLKLDERIIAFEKGRPPYRNLAAF